ncbi:hypothetical protein HOP50_16g77570 [Chloropicon primus]|uniref:Phytocyanin domain-containing protein n=1 Tax=Chloropicon primus TaxID=1764295 RepID=A0A5B8MXY2_9CHLO|nr:hypothetical protein A3770_16p77290 [Chloropicon primus]UPR04416.1 hypothetical protein HOP50_16g77570 [Chloropicon primus]|eukprot:QDZ25211.1 hypothetical protein A3770_16p77290 [Chloropicon primus]
MAAAFATVVCVALATLLLGSTKAEQIEVKNSRGQSTWMEGSSYPEIKAQVGDELVFKWYGLHNVVLMASAPDDNCANIGKGTDLSGVVTGGEYKYLIKPTDFDENSGVSQLKFSCSVGSHCQNGQFLVVTLEGGTTNDNNPGSYPGGGDNSAAAHGYNGAGVTALLGSVLLLLAVIL